MILKYIGRKFILNIIGYQYSKKKCIYNSDANWLKCKLELKSKNLNFKIIDPLLNVNDILVLKKWFSELLEDKKIDDYFNTENTLFLKCNNHHNFKTIEIEVNVGSGIITTIFLIDDKEIKNSINYFTKIIKRFPERNVENGK